MRLIKKYPNRRLYDTHESKYITVAQIRELIMNGADVRIVEESTGDDITRSVLVQVLSEQEQTGQPILSDRALMQIIRFYGHPMQSFMSSYIEKSLDAFTSSQEQVFDKMNETLNQTPLEAMQDTVQEMTMSGMKTWTDLQQSVVDAMTPGAASSQTKSRADNNKEKDED